jgi:hypothetical protein
MLARELFLCRNWTVVALQLGIVFMKLMDFLLLYVVLCRIFLDMTAIFPSSLPLIYCLVLVLLGESC